MILRHLPMKTLSGSSVSHRVGRISIDVTDDEHKKLKAMAALRGKSIKDYVLERTLATSEAEHAALQELEELLDKRIPHRASLRVPPKPGRAVPAHPGRVPREHGSHGPAR